MNSSQINQLVAYLKALAAKNQGENVQTNQQAAAGSGGGKLSSAIEKFVPKALKWGYGAYTQPAAAYAASAAPMTGTMGASGVAEGAGLAGGYGSAATGAGVGMSMAQMQAGTSSLGGMGGSGMTVGGVASVAAPLIMAYLKYQAGSGENTPIRKQYETRGAGKMLSDMIGGKTIDPKNTYQDYGLYPRSIPSWLDPNSTTNSERGPGAETIDPRGYKPEELYALMHSYGTGARQQQGLGNSGYSDQQIDDMFGDQKGGLSKLLGGDTPDWSKTTWDSSGWTAPNTVNKQKELTDKLGAMSQSERGDVMNRNRQWLPEGGALDDQFYLESLEREREREELEKLLGYKLGG